MQKIQIKLITVFIIKIMNLVRWGGEAGKIIGRNSRAAASLSAKACFSSSCSFWFCSLLEVWSSSSPAHVSRSSDWTWDRAAWASVRALLVWVREAWVLASSVWVAVRLFWASERDVWRSDLVLSVSLSHCDLRA